LIMAVS